MLMDSTEYISIVDNIKKEIQVAQYRAVVHANKELLLLYYDIGSIINEHKVWGNKFIENLARDIRLEFPKKKGFSERNLKYMAKFASTYSKREFVQQAVAQIPWGHNVLLHQIESGLYERQVFAKKISNFDSRLPSPQSELANQTMKDPYVFDFIPFQENMLERDIEQALVRDITKLLLELGTGFAFLVISII